MKTLGKNQRQGSARKLQQGFTLIELVIVLAVLGALASIAVPQLTGLQEKAELNGEATSIVSEIKNIFAQDLSDGEITFNWNGECSGYDGGVFDGNDNFEGLDQAEKYQLYDDEPDGNFVEIGLPEYDETTNQTNQFNCYLGLR